MLGLRAISVVPASFDNFGVIFFLLLILIFIKLSGRNYLYMQQNLFFTTSALSFVDV
jgi:hypothetical protein